MDTAKLVKNSIRSLAKRLGYDVVRADGSGRYPPDFSPQDVATIDACRPYTMTSPVRMFSLMRAVEYVVAARVPGSFVECGVWRGGSMMVVARTLLQLGRTDADLFLFDTFEGMTEPTDVDVRHDDAAAGRKFEQLSERGEKWCYASLEEVRRNVASTGWNAARVHYVKGTVEETIPRHAPDGIALLRLDTDWYDSTKHELEQLYPRLSPGGVLLLDDYGHWKGSRKATDEYRHAHGISTLLQRVDESCRLTIKPL